MVSIIIRTYNEEKYLEDLLERISNQYYKDYEVILVDSGSKDNTLNIAKKFDFVNIINIKKEDFTFGHSLNVGIKKSKGNYCVMISGHCLPKDTAWLETLIDPFKDKKVGIVYGKQIGYTTTKFSEHQIFKSWFPDEKKEKQLTPFCNNANSAIRKSLWKKLGGYDEKVSGLEDVLIATKMLKETDMYLSYQPLSSVYHIHDETWNQIRNRYYREAITYSSIHLTEKFNILDFIKLSFINIKHDIIQLFKSDGNISNILSIFMFRINQFWGTYKGYRYTKMYNTLRKKFYYPI